MATTQQILKTQQYLAKVGFYQETIEGEKIEAAPINGVLNRKTLQALTDFEFSKEWRTTEELPPTDITELAFARLETFMKNLIASEAAVVTPETPEEN